MNEDIGIQTTPRDHLKLEMMNLKWQQSYSHVFLQSHSAVQKHKEGNKVGLKEVWVLPQDWKVQKEIPIIV